MSNKNKLKLVLFFLFIPIIVSGCSLKASNRRYKEAVKEYNAGNFERAEELFIEAIKKNEDKAEFYLDYGFTLIHLSRYIEAISQFERVILDKEIIMIKENNKLAYRGIGIAYYMMQQYEDAIESFDKALEISVLSELDMDILSYKSSSLELSGRIDEAVNVYTKMFENGIEVAGFYRTRGDLYRKQGNYEEALLDYNKALKLEKGDFNLYFGKFAVLKELGKDEEAKEALTMAGEIEVKTDADRLDLAKVHFYQENKIALLEFSQLVETGYTEAYFFLAEIYLKEKNYEEAIIAYENYLMEGNAPSITLYNQMLTCYLQLENYDLASDYLKLAKQFQDVSIQKQLTRNEIVYLEHTGRFSEALELIEDYLKEYPKEEEAYNDYLFLKSRVTAIE